MEIEASAFIEKGVKVFLFLDFDGVINSFPSALTDEDLALEDHYTDVAEGVGVVHPYGFGEGGERSYPLHWSPTLIQELNSILADERVQLLWLTSWEENIIPVEEDLLKLKPTNPSRVLTLQKRFSDYNNNYAKLEAWELFTEKLPRDSAHIIWIDDDVLLLHETRLEHPDENNHYKKNYQRYISALPICPRSVLGLQPSHLESIRQYLNTALEEEPHE